MVEDGGGASIISMVAPRRDCAGFTAAVIGAVVETGPVGGIPSIVRLNAARGAAGWGCAGGSALAGGAGLAAGGGFGTSATTWSATSGTEAGASDDGGGWEADLGPAPVGGRSEAGAAKPNMVACERKTDDGGPGSTSVESGLGSSVTVSASATAVMGAAAGAGMAGTGATEGVRGGTCEGGRTYTAPQ